MKSLRIMPIFLMIAGLAACNLPRSAAPLAPVSLNGAGPQTWVDAPLDQMHLPLAPYEVVFHGTDEGGVTGVELHINDAAVQVPVPDGGGGKLLTARYMWSPAAPGQYVLRARSMNSGGAWSAEALVTVWVGDIITPSVTPSITPTPTAVTITPTPVAPAGPLSIQLLGVSTNQFYFGATSCGPTSVSLQVQVSDAARIPGVTLFYKLRIKDTGEYTEWNSNFDLKPQGGGKFALGLSSSQVDGLRQSENWFIYQFIGTGADHKPNSRSQVFGDVSLSRCGNSLSPWDNWIDAVPLFIVDPTPTIEYIR